MKIVQLLQRIGTEMPDYGFGEQGIIPVHVHVILLQLVYHVPGRRLPDIRDILLVHQTHDQDPEPLPRYRFPDLVRPLDRHPGHVLRQRVVDGAAGKNHLTVGAHLLCPLDTVVRVHGDTGPRVAR